VNSEDPQRIVQRARAFPHKVPVIVGSLYDISHFFLDALRDDEVTLFVVLKGYENPGRRLRLHMMQRPPYSFGARLLERLGLDLDAVDPAVAMVVLCCLVDQQCSANANELCGGSATIERQCRRVCASLGLRGLGCLRKAGRAIRAACAIIEFGTTAHGAATYCGCDRKTVCRTLKGVTGMPMLADLQRLDMSDVVECAYAWITSAPPANARPPSPPTRVRTR
jgi:hypothetical protein